MQLYLDSYGAFLAARNGMFAVRTKSGGEQQFAVRDVQAILLTKSTGLSTDAALLAASNDIPVLIIDANTHYPLAQVSSGRPGSIAAIRKNQALFARAPAGFDWVALQLAEKIAAQRTLLALFAEDAAAPAGFSADVRLADRVLSTLETEFRKPLSTPGFDIETASGLFRGREGTASRLYFNQLAKILTGTFASVSFGIPDTAEPDPSSPEGPEPDMLRTPHAEFRTRQKRPAYDPFNTLLNYLYGMLYTSVHLALLKSGLDPYMGILHADRYGAAPTLVFDAIEPYRPWADTVALRLALDGRIGPESFEQRPEPTEGLWLSGAGKDIGIESMLAYLEEPAPMAGETRKIKRRVQMDLRAQQLAVMLKEYQG